MIKKVLIIGFGSAGKKHYNILKKNNFIKIFVLTKQKKIKFKIKKLSDVKSCNPDLIIISSLTNKHFEQLQYIEKNLSNKIILIEKPIFDKFRKFKVKKNKVFVGYNLRCDPLMLFLRKKVLKKKIWSINIICNSYLPFWRPKRDYSKTYSASRKLGGGVLLDLSHELDYTRWLFGNINLKFVISNKISNLNINVDDNLLLVGKTQNSKLLQINLNYFSKIMTRKIFIAGPKLNIVADLINKRIVFHENGRRYSKSWKITNNSKSFEQQIKFLFKKRYKNLATFEESLNLLQLINKIRKFNKK